MSTNREIINSIQYILGDPKSSGEYSVFRILEFNELDKPQRKRTFVGNYNPKAILDYLRFVNTEKRSHKPRVKINGREVKIYIPGRPWHLLFIPRGVTPY